ncbi:hypothetical protein [Methanococcus vannielii]|uniref:hypothetical protein n=1 Tax=Methanococcus vannielii TaxID=2187 RepID=UPI00064F77D3|nr:hypothetical protein [Methanococcus vannielii]
MLMFIVCLIILIFVLKYWIGRLQDKGYDICNDYTEWRPFDEYNVKLDYKKNSRNSVECIIHNMDSIPIIVKIWCKIYDNNNIIIDKTWPHKNIVHPGESFRTDTRSLDTPLGDRWQLMCSIEKY